MNKTRKVMRRAVQARRCNEKKKPSALAAMAVKEYLQRGGAMLKITALTSQKLGW
jgi:hypothetical protein